MDSGKDEAVPLALRSKPSDVVLIIHQHRSIGVLLGVGNQNECDQVALVVVKADDRLQILFEVNFTAADDKGVTLPAVPRISSS